MTTSPTRACAGGLLNPLADVLPRLRPTRSRAASRKAWKSEDIVSSRASSCVNRSSTRSRREAGAVSGRGTRTPVCRNRSPWKVRSHWSPSAATTSPAFLGHLPNRSATRASGSRSGPVARQRLPTGDVPRAVHVERSIERHADGPAAGLDHAVARLDPVPEPDQELVAEEVARRRIGERPRHRRHVERPVRVRLGGGRRTGEG